MADASAAPVVVADPAPVPPPVPDPVAVAATPEPVVIAAPPPEVPVPAPLPVVDTVTADPVQQQSIAGFVQDAGLHDTTIDQQVEPTVTHETVKPTEIDAEQKAVVKDIEQEHYHTTVQTISDAQVLPEQRTYNVKAVSEQVFEHGDNKPIDPGPQYRDERIVNETRHESKVLPTVVGEHIHHHIHERIQPIIQREIVQPSVVYTTVPIHEIHHDPIRYHATTALPSITLAEYQRQGGALGGHEPLHGDKRHGDPNTVGEPTSNIKDW